MPSFPESVQRYRLLIAILALVAAVTSYTSLSNSTVNVLPNFQQTRVEVQTEALGLAAAEVEAMITVPLEADMLNGVPWLERIESRSITGLSSIELVFEPGTDLMVARQMVQERLTAAHALPNVSKPPVMRQPVATEGRVAQIGLVSEELSLMDLSVLARWTVKPRLLGVPGVANIAIWGERARQMQVLVDPDALQKAKVKLDQVVATSGNSMWVSPLSYLNASTPGTGGFIDTPNQRLGIHHVFPIATADDMRQLPLAGRDDLYLGDVADVVEGHQPLIGDALINGKPGILLVIEKFPWANTADVAAGIETAMSSLIPGLPGVETHTDLLRAGDATGATSAAFGKAALTGAVLALVVFFALTRSLSVTLVAAAAAGVAALCVAGAVMQLLTTLDAVVMAGVFAAAAYVVQDIAGAVIIRMPGQAGGYAAWRRPLVYASLAGILAVVPAFFVAGIPGIVTGLMGLAVVAGIVVSLVAASLVVPSLAALVSEYGGKSGTPAALKLPSPGARGLGRPGLVGTAALAVIGGVMLVRAPVQPVPLIESRDAVVEWTTPPGTSIEAVRVQGEAASAKILAADIADAVTVQVGRAEHSDEVFNANAGTLWIALKDGLSLAQAKPQIEALIAGVAGLDGRVESYQNRQIQRSLLRAQEGDIRVRVYGHEYDMLRAKAEEITAALEATKGVAEAALMSRPVEPIVEIEVDMEAARAARIKPGDVRRATAAIFGGIQVGSLFEEQKVFDVVVWGNAEQRREVALVENALIDTPDGGAKRLGDVAEVRVSDAPSFINRSAVSRFVDIVVETGGADPGAVARQIPQILAEIDYPLEYHAEIVGGTWASGADRTRLLQVIGACAIGIVLLMQALFSSWIRAGIAVVAAAAAGGAALIAIAAAGMLTTAGVVGAVVAFGLGLRDASRTLAAEDAGAESSVTLVANTTAAALLVPVLFVTAPGLAFVHAAAVAVLAGLAASTAIAVYVLPKTQLGESTGTEGVSHAT